MGHFILVSLIGFSANFINPYVWSLFTTIGGRLSCIYDLLCFVEWLHDNTDMNVELTILGTLVSIPSSYPPRARFLLEKQPYIKTLTRFSSFDGQIATAPS